MSVSFFTVDNLSLPQSSYNAQTEEVSPLPQFRPLHIHPSQIGSHWLIFSLFCVSPDPFSASEILLCSYLHRTSHNDGNSVPRLRIKYSQDVHCEI